MALVSGAARGIARERKVRVLLEERGYWTARAAGSLGDADVIAVKVRPAGGADVLLVEVKSTAGGPYERFGPAQRAELIEAAVKTGATPWLVWWPPRRGPVWIPVAEWPASREAVAA